MDRWYIELFFSFSFSFFDELENFIHKQGELQERSADLHPDYRFNTRRVTAQIKRAKYIVKWKPFSKACVVPFAPLGIQLTERGLREHRWNITVDALNSPGNILAREYRWKNSPIPLIPFLVMSSKTHLEDITVGKIYVCIAYKIFAAEKLMNLLHS